MFNYEKYKEISDLIEKNQKKTQIVAISKNHTKESVLQAIYKGVRIFGENRVLEAKDKFISLKNKYTDIEIHLTGPLQSNKVKDAVNLFDVFHTLDREKIAKLFSNYKEKLNSKKIYIQVNIARESSKSGVFPEHLKDFLNFCKTDNDLKICGLMCIPPIDKTPQFFFKDISELASKNGLKNISIGMSNDYEIALQYNPKYIRLGTILFGKRK